MLRSAGGRFDPVQLPEVGLLVDRFNGSNQRVHERYGALVPCVSGRDVVADVAAAIGIDPAGWYRRQLINAVAGGAPAAAARIAPASRRAVRDGLRQDEAARSDAASFLVAGAAAAVALSAGESSARTALVAFGLVSFVLAVSAAWRMASRTFEAAGVIVDRGFFDDWAARLRIVAYALVALYASFNALLDLDARRFAPDALSIPGLMATAAAVLVPALLMPARERSGDDNLFVVCGIITLLVEAAHAATPAWWLDTTIGLVIAIIAALRIHQLWSCPHAAPDPAPRLSGRTLA